MPRSLPRPLALLGGACVVAVALSACGGAEPTKTATVAAESAPDPGAGATTTPPPEPVVEASTTLPPTATPPTTAATPRTTVPAKSVPKVTTPPTTAAKAPATTPTTAASVTPRFTPGQRIEFTTAGVQAAAAALHQRIPLFNPTDAQLRTFADAACTSFDQGQTQAQVQAAVRQAVTYVQGASLGAADAEFMVRTVVQLRCPGYLP